MLTETIITTFIICIFDVACCSTIQENLFSENHKMIGESSFFASIIWTEYSKLLAIDDKDKFCEGNEGVIFPDFYEKKLYYRCQNGKKELYQCLDDFEFDSKRLRCTPKNLLSNDTNLNDCSHQMDGYYPDLGTNCQDYFRCKNGIKVEMLSCSQYESFSFHLQTCRLKSEVTCAKSNCHLENDGFSIVPGSKCQAYYYCQKGIRSDFLCAKGTTFDIQSKSCVENGICYEPVCTGRVDGTYADTTHNCLRSFSCRGGEVNQVDSCPDGTKYNGYACVDSHFHCEKPEKTAAAFYFRADDECKNLRDGSHIVPGTDCRNVRICLRGKTTAAFECQKDERYDGSSCLHKDIVPCDDLCSMKDDGYYADEYAKCESYYSCRNEKVLKRKQCPAETAFNGQTCVPKHLAYCPEKARSYTAKCLGLRDGFHPAYLKSCQDYFYCYNHEVVLTGSCSSGYVYNGKECVKSGDIICDGPKEMDECINLPTGIYRNKTSGCTNYYYCNNGLGTVLSCPKDQRFNGYKCVSVDEYSCTNPDGCVGESDGYKQDEISGCRSYYYCFNGNKITYVCPNGLIFNGSSCVSQDIYECPFAPSKDCVGLHDGYHPDESSGCKKYFYCYKGEKLNTLFCGGKKIFDGRGCVLTEDPGSTCLKILKNQCNSKEDGTYADFETDCRRYFTCKNNKMTAANWCPIGFSFNGNICLKDFDCKKRNLNTVCAGKQIGFYQDFSSNCKSYYFCFLGTKTMGTCPRGTIFNGHFCIDSNYYKCPRNET